MLSAFASELGIVIAAGRSEVLEELGDAQPWDSRRIVRESSSLKRVKSADCGFHNEKLTLARPRQNDTFLLGIAGLVQLQ